MSKGRQKKKQKGQKKGLWILLVFLLLTGCYGSLTEKENEPRKSIGETSAKEQQAASESESENVTQGSKTIASERQEAVEPGNEPTETPVETPVKASPIYLTDIPGYDGHAYVAINGNVPYFDDSELKTESFETYSNLDSLGRCGVAYANIGVDLMPTEKRDSIGQVKPSGWHTVKYNGVVDGNYLYNRCHLIGYQLTAENANEKNLITGTRYFNTEGMLPFENMVADYIKETNHHVLYRVTPVYSGDNLLADGVLMEAKSVEDAGEGILFNVYCYNVQPGISIDYATGQSKLAEGTVPVSAENTVAPGNDTKGNQPEESQVTKASEDVTESRQESQPQGTTYIMNTNTKKFHLLRCSSINQMKESNKSEFTGTRDALIQMGYESCKRCNP